MSECVHISTINDGAIVNFKGSCYAYMKVCDENGVGGVVRLWNGLYAKVNDIHKVFGVEPTDAIFVATDLDEYYYHDEEN